MVLELHAYIGRLFGLVTEPNPAVAIVPTQHGSIISSRRSWNVCVCQNDVCLITILMGLFLGVKALDQALRRQSYLV